MFPLTFASNAYVPTDTVPGWLQAFLKVNPVSHAVAAVRGLTDSGAVTRPLLWTLGWMAALLVVLVPLSLAAYRRRQ
jgi:ABC-type multidrug transport system permease subunit